jgi:hypothetical protein
MKIGDEGRIALKDGATLENAPPNKVISKGVVYAGIPAPRTMKMAPMNVIPAKAGIHAIYRSTRSWIPAFAGMTI